MTNRQCKCFLFNLPFFLNYKYFFYIRRNGVAQIILRDTPEVPRYKSYLPAYLILTSFTVSCRTFGGYISSCWFFSYYSFPYVFVLNCTYYIAPFYTSLLHVTTHLLFPGFSWATYFIFTLDSNFKYCFYFLSFLILCQPSQLSLFYDCNRFYTGCPKK